MKKSCLLALIFSCFLSLAFAENHSEEFWKLMKDDNYEEAVTLLSDWEKQDAKNPELYVCYFNMYLRQASQEQMHLEPFLPENFNGQYMKAKNEDGDEFYIYSVIEYDDEISQKAFVSIDKGLSYNPKRLDMYFGKAHFYYLLGDYDKQFEVIKQVLKLNKKNKASWLWSENTPLEDSGVGFEESLHEYVIKWYNLKNPDVYVYIRDLSLLWIKQYPKNPIAYNDAGLAYMLMGDLDNAKKYYSAGYDLDPSDMILLGNLGHIYYSLGDPEKAIECYKKMIEIGDDDDIAYAQSVLDTYFKE